MNKVNKAAKLPPQPKDEEAVRGRDRSLYIYAQIPANIHLVYFELHVVFNSIEGLY